MVTALCDWVVVLGCNLFQFCLVKDLDVRTQWLQLAEFKVNWQVHILISVFHTCFWMEKTSRAFIVIWQFCIRLSSGWISVFYRHCSMFGNSFWCLLPCLVGVSGRKSWQKPNGRLKYKHYSDPNSHQCTMKHIFKYLLWMFSCATFWQSRPLQDLFLHDIKRVLLSLTVVNWIFF